MQSRQASAQNAACRMADRRPFCCQRSLGALVLLRTLAHTGEVFR